METWKQIPGFDGYEVSDLGNVRSVDRLVLGGKWGKEQRKGKLLKQGKDSYGYLHVGLSKDKKTTTKKVHRLVLLAFVGESKLQVNHKDSNRTNNHLSNLEYVTATQNVQHSIQSGNAKRKGEGNPNARLKADDVVNMRQLKTIGWTYKSIGEMYGMDYRNVARIVTGKQWAQLK